MGRRRNTVDFYEGAEIKKKGGLTLADAKKLFLRDRRYLAKQTQRWHHENLNSLEKILLRQEVVVDDVASITTAFVKDRYVYYMLEDMGLKPNTINGRIRALKAFAAYLFSEGYIQKFRSRSDTHSCGEGCDSNFLRIETNGYSVSKEKGREIYPGDFLPRRLLGEYLPSPGFIVYGLQI